MLRGEAWVTPSSPPRDRKLLERERQDARAHRDGEPVGRKLSDNLAAVGDIFAQHRPPLPTWRTAIPHVPQISPAQTCVM